MSGSSGLLVGIAAEEVLHAGSALDDVGDGLQVDLLAVEQIPTVDDEVDVEPQVGNLGDVLGVVGVCKLVVKILDGSVGVDKISGESVVDGITPCKSSIVVVDGAGAVSVLPAALLLAELP